MLRECFFKITKMLYVDYVIVNSLNFEFYPKAVISAWVISFIFLIII